MTITDINTKRAESRPAITVYSKPNCVQCRAVYRHLDKREIPYTTVDITEDATAYDYVRSLNYMQAPVVVTSNGDHRSGFDPDWLNEVAV